MFADIGVFKQVPSSFTKYEIASVDLLVDVLFLYHCQSDASWCLVFPFRNIFSLQRTHITSTLSFDNARRNKFQLNSRRTCSELPPVKHMDIVRYLLRCHGRYKARLLQLSLSTSAVDQHRGDENTYSSPTALTACKTKARKRYRKCIFVQN